MKMKTGTWCILRPQYVFLSSLTCSVLTYTQGGFSSTFFFYSTDDYLQTDYAYGTGTGHWDETKATMVRRVAGTGGPMGKLVILWVIFSFNFKNINDVSMSRTTYSKTYACEHTYNHSAENTGQMKIAMTLWCHANKGWKAQLPWQPLVVHSVWCTCGWCHFWTQKLGVTSGTIQSRCQGACCKCAKGKCSMLWHIM